MACAFPLNCVLTWLVESVTGDLVVKIYAWTLGYPAIVYCKARSCWRSWFPIDKFVVNLLRSHYVQFESCLGYLQNMDHPYFLTDLERHFGRHDCDALALVQFAFVLEFRIALGYGKVCRRCIHDLVSVSHIQHCWTINQILGQRGLRQLLAA